MRHSRFGQQKKKNHSYQKTELTTFDSPEQIFYCTLTTFPAQNMYYISTSQTLSI